MIICSCHAVTDRDIRRCAERGATRLSDVVRHCRAASGCGGCRVAVRAVFEEARSDLAAAHAVDLAAASASLLLSPGLAVAAR